MLNKLRKIGNLLLSYWDIRLPVAFQIIKNKEIFGDCCEIADNVYLIRISNIAFKNDVALFMTVFHELAHIVFEQYGYDMDEAHSAIYILEDIILNNNLPQLSVKVDKKQIMSLSPLGRKIARVLARLGDKNYFENAKKVIKALDGDKNEKV